ncbi:hypothetical protein [Acidiphilium acidophilum]|uniref:Uncharacterized protein n=1 Tax=Acidiphilium acidophilum TaxID=76588 RepID=A0AAW9DPD8_ACIAO|nr:hypothetical protein [Acidiphilium acidophilum]MDX5930497.1 hypothetical protein [Acidiphilium acidophilum]
MKLSDRVAALETAATDMQEIHVRGGLDDPANECAAASPTPSLEWFAAPGELDAWGRTTAAFTDRVRGEAKAAGAEMVVWFSPGGFNAA